MRFRLRQTGLVGFALITVYVLADCAVEFLYLGRVGLWVALGTGKTRLANGIHGVAAGHWVDGILYPFGVVR